ncbi:hypothetical protein BALU111458_12280 [Bacillus luti]
MIKMQVSLYESIMRIYNDLLKWEELGAVK